jgi:beta-phosphoglucomutase-like phosphatase (HAD superfamily)
VVDLDGTLVDTEPLHRQSYELILGALLGRDVDVPYSEMVGRSGESIWRYLIRKHSLDQQPTRLNQLRKVVLGGLLSANKPRPIEAVVQAVRCFHGPKMLLTTQELSSAMLILVNVGLATTFDEIVSTQTSGDSSKMAAIRRFAQQRAAGVG